MTHLLILILTSSQARLCRRAWNSVQDQLPHTIDSVTTKVVVNSTDAAYVEKVRQALPPDTEVIETVSTGLPGVGHNSCLKYFRDHPAYDYLFHLDGDDVVYDTALCALGMLMDCSPIFVGSVGLDRIVNTVNLGKNKGSHLGYGLYRTSAKTDEDPRVWQKFPPLNPFSVPLQKTHTPSRPLLFGRGIFDAPIPVRWSETLVKHDDYLVFLTSMENHYRHGVEGIYICPTTQVYAYNIMNYKSSTKTKRVDFQEQQTMFDADTADIIHLRREWDSVFATSVPTLLLPRIPAPEDHKTKHLVKHVTNFALQAYQAGNDHFAARRYTKALQEYRKAYGEGLYSGPLFVNMGVSYIQKQQPAKAAACFQHAAKLPKTADVAKDYLSRLTGTARAASVKTPPAATVLKAPAVKSVELAHRYRPLALTASALDSSSYLDLCLRFIAE